jgi:hypothetical protein
MLGAAAVGALALVGALAVAALADASGRDAFDLAIAGVQLVAFERTGAGTSTTLGPALALLPLVGGLANALAALVVRRFG